MKTLTTHELAQRVARELGASEPQTEAVLDRAIAAMKSELQRGNRIELPQFLTLSVKSGQPIAARTAAEAPVNLPPARLIQTEIDAEFRKKIEGAGVYHILLVVPHKHFFTNFMALRLATARSQVTVAEGEDQARTWLAQRPVDLVVLDAGLPQAAELCRAVKTKRETSLTAILRIFAEGEDPNRVAGLEVVCDEKIQEPFELGDLVALAESELGRTTEERNFFEQAVRLKLHTTEELVDQANEVVARLLSQSALDEEAQVAVAAAFHEAADNAARHGNRYDEARLIDVQYLVDREKAVLTVEDQGQGFDAQSYLQKEAKVDPLAAARSRHDTGRTGGLGIMMMLKCVDRLEYNAAGNKITLTKHVRPRTPGPA